MKKTNFIYIVLIVIFAGYFCTLSVLQIVGAVERFGSLRIISTCNQENEYKVELEYPSHIFKNNRFYNVYIDDNKLSSIIISVNWENHSHNVGTVNLREPLEIGHIFNNISYSLKLNNKWWLYGIMVMLTWFFAIFLIFFNNKIPRTLQVTQQKLFFSGIVIVLIPAVYSFFLGENTLVRIHDQLDGEIMAYILAAENFGTKTFYDQFMGGVPSTSLQVPSPGFVILYIFFSPVIAFLLQNIICITIAYIGMYVLLTEIHKQLFYTNNIIYTTFIVFSSILFAYLPHYILFGLSICGIPLVFYGMIVHKTSIYNKSKYFNYLIFIIYGLFSSPILVGYVVAFILMLFTIIAFVKNDKIYAKKLSISLILLCSTYLLVNFNILTQLLFSQGETSHKTALVLNPEKGSIVKAINFLIQGQYHAEASQIYIVYFSLFVLLIVGIYFFYNFFINKVNVKNTDQIKKLKYLTVSVIILIVLCFFIALFKVYFQTSIMIHIRNMLGNTLRAMQFDRIYFLYPVLWYLIFGLSCTLFYELIDLKIKNKAYLILPFMVPWIIMCATLSLNEKKGNSHLQNITNSSESVKTHLNEDVFRWNAYFAEDLFNLAHLEMPIDKSSYRVISIGMHPSVSLYNGFYTLDGYSNNYPLEYKEKFSKIIHKELLLDEGRFQYFYEWGNRCYAFVNNVDFLQGKNDVIKIQNLNFNFEQFYNLGGRYIFSSVEIANPNTYNLHLLGEYSTDESYYKLRLYEYKVE